MAEEGFKPKSHTLPNPPLPPDPPSPNVSERGNYPKKIVALLSIAWKEQISNDPEDAYLNTVYANSLAPSHPRSTPKSFSQKSEQPTGIRGEGNQAGVKARRIYHIC